MQKKGKTAPVLKSFHLYLGACDGACLLGGSPATATHCRTPSPRLWNARLHSASAAVAYFVLDVHYSLCVLHSRVWHRLRWRYARLLQHSLSTFARREAASRVLTLSARTSSKDTPSPKFGFRMPDVPRRTPQLGDSLTWDLRQGSSVALKKFLVATL